MRAAAPEMPDVKITSTSAYVFSVFVHEIQPTIALSIKNQARASAGRRTFPTPPDVGQVLHAVTSCADS
jgi:hypothetical protein